MGKIEANRPAADYLTKVEQLLVESMRWLPGASFPVMMGGMQTLALAKTLLGEQVTESELQVALRGSPFNPTTEMNLALWTLAGQVRADPKDKSLPERASSRKLSFRQLDYETQPCRMA